MAKKMESNMRVHAYAITQTATPSGNICGQSEDTRVEIVCQSPLYLKQ